MCEETFTSAVTPSNLLARSLLKTTHLWETSYSPLKKLSAHFPSSWLYCKWVSWQAGGVDGMIYEEEDRSMEWERGGEGKAMNEQLKVAGKTDAVSKCERHNSITLKARGWRQYSKWLQYGCGGSERERRKGDTLSLSRCCGENIYKCVKLCEKLWYWHRPTDSRVVHYQAIRLK